MVEGVSEKGRSVQIGIYQHYKGQLYEVMGVGHHTETEEELVFYRSLYGRYGFWVRPVSMFCGEIEMNGKRVSRFTYLGKAGSLEPQIEMSKAR